VVAAGADDDDVVDGATVTGDDGVGDTDVAVDVGLGVGDTDVGDGV
jgi:hypothetical protein